MKNENVKSIARNALIVAVIAIMSFVPYVGYIGIPAVGISITTIHLAVLIFAWMFGWKEGLVSGLAFGIFSLIKAATMPNSPIDVYFVNPLISVFPRVVFGFLAGIIFDILRKVRKPQARLIANIAVCGIMTLFHSILTLSMLYVMAGNKEALQQFNYFSLILTLVSWNGLLELAASIVITPLLILPLDKAFPAPRRSAH